MSLLSQIRGELNPSGSVDRKLSPLFNFIEEYDRHFGHHHRHSVNPHFDIEEDELSYYLVGELPGAAAQDISIDILGNLNLTISGSVSQTLHPGKPTGRTSPPAVAGGAQRGGAGVDVPVEILGNGHGYPDEDLRENDTPPEAKEDKYINGKKPTTIGGRRVLLNERLTGSFHRTFNFQSSIVKEGINASTENGLLFLVVPKKLASLDEVATKQIAIGNGKPHDF